MTPACSLALTEKQHDPGTRWVPRATRRPRAGALLTVILVGSRLERREDGPSRTIGPTRPRDRLFRRYALYDRDGT